MDHQSKDHMLPKQSDVTIVCVTLAVLFAGPVLGCVLARLCAPGSGIALLIGFVLLPLAHLAGRVAWAVAGFVVDSRSAGRRAIRVLGNLGRWDDASSPPHEALEHGTFEGRFPHGGSIFILVHALFGLAAGLIVGLALTDVSARLVVCAYTFAGTLYGSIVYFIAWNGYLLMCSEKSD